MFYVEHPIGGHYDFFTCNLDLKSFILLQKIGEPSEFTTRNRSNQELNLKVLAADRPTKAVESWHLLGISQRYNRKHTHVPPSTP